MTSRPEPVIGLEVHVQLRTGRKLFCGDAVEFGAEPNSRVCPVCLGLPGALPVLDSEAVELAVRTALALGCTVHRASVFARKSYFYPDLPKGYQITQYDRPLATGGFFRFDVGGEERSLGIRRIHLEEDAGKSLHDRIPGRTAVDLNRAGVPLVEIVTAPDLGGPGEARACLVALKRHLEYLEVSDCAMEKGSLRVDANVSLAAAGGDPGPKTELKNLNTFAGVERALTLEVERQRAAASRGEVVEAGTRLWDGERREVRPLRSKEDAPGYRYFPEPDLPPLMLAPSRLEDLRASLPEDPRTRERRFRDALGLSAQHAGVLAASRPTGDYYEALLDHVDDAHAAASWVLGPVLESANERGVGLEGFPVEPGRVAELMEMVDAGDLSRRAAPRVLAILADEGGRPRQIAEAEDLLQITDPERIGSWVDGVLAELAEEAGRYRAGEDRILDHLVGRVMARSEGRADPHLVRRLLLERLEEG